ncbi:hypothetical protein F4810DRAFT_723331 [Camillea tinctor]|nr:hypothetical protein F4810DRAFT_723331 [Camillea tinctor]
MEPFLHDEHFGKKVCGVDVKPLIIILASINRRFVVGQDSLGRTLLHIAAERFRVSEINLFLNRGIDINVQDVLGRRELIVKRLLEEPGLNISIKDSYGRLAIDYAIQDRRSEIPYLFKESIHYRSTKDMNGIIDASLYNLKVYNNMYDEWIRKRRLC